MKKTFVLTSFVALTVATQATSAMADYTENSSYGETCNVTNLGAYDSSTSIAVAHFAPDTYQCTAGQYLGADSTACGACPAGSFCSSADTYTFNASAAQGATACPSGYTNSDSGATASTQCYRACSTSDFAHSAEVEGKMYYNGTSGAGVNDCVIMGCDSGYHADREDFVLPAGYPNLTETIGMGAGTAHGYVNHSGIYTNGTGATSQQTYGITEADTWGVDYGSGKGIITGKAICSTQGGIRQERSHSMLNNVVGDFTNGQYCWCQIDGYTPSGGTKQSLSALWVFIWDDGSAANCVDWCARDCSKDLRANNNLSYRRAIFSSLGTSVPLCKANEITVRWGDKDGGIHAQTTCTYGGTLYTPTTAPTAPKGHHFTGWTIDPDEDFEFME